MNIRKLSVALVALLTLCGAGVARADGDEENIPVRSAYGAPLDFRVIQVSAFNPSIGVSTGGTDQLAPDTKNHISVLNNRTIQIEFHPVVTPAVSPLTYRVWFCRFGAFIAPDAANSGCVAMLDPASTTTPFKSPLVLTVDASGAAKGTAEFPALAANAAAGSDIWSGSFVITRTVGNVPALIQFVSAFALPTGQVDDDDDDADDDGDDDGNGHGKPVKAEDGATVEVKGAIAGLDATAKSFLLAGEASFPVVVNDTTRFIGRYKSFEELSNGMDVDIRGTFAKDSTTNTLFILAERIRAGRED